MFDAVVQLCKSVVVSSQFWVYCQVRDQMRKDYKNIRKNLKQNIIICLIHRNTAFDMNYSDGAIRLKYVSGYPTTPRNFKL